MNNTPILETERLILRKFTRDDLAYLFKIYGDTEVNIFLPWFPLKSMEEAEAFFEERYSPLYARPSGYGYAVCLKSDNIPVGYVNVSTDDGHDLGYGLRREFWGRGIIREGAGAVLHQVKKDGMAYVTATHDVNNPRSGGVMKALGMTYKYSYSELWQPKNLMVTFRMYQLNFNGDESETYEGYRNKYKNSFIENIASAAPEKD